MGYWFQSEIEKLLMIYKMLFCAQKSVVWSCARLPSQTVKCLFYLYFTNLNWRKKKTQSGLLDTTPYCSAVQWSAGMAIQWSLAVYCNYQLNPPTRSWNRKSVRTNFRPVIIRNMPRLWGWAISCQRFEKKLSPLKGTFSLYRAEAVSVYKSNCLSSRVVKRPLDGSIQCWCSAIAPP